MDKEKLFSKPSSQAGDSLLSLHTDELLQNGGN